LSAKEFVLQVPAPDFASDIADPGRWWYSTRPT